MIILRAFQIPTNDICGCPYPLVSSLNNSLPFVGHELFPEQHSFKVFYFYVQPLVISHNRWLTDSLASLSHLLQINLKEQFPNGENFRLFYYSPNILPGSFKPLREGLLLMSETDWTYSRLADSDILLPYYSTSAFHIEWEGGEDLDIPIWCGDFPFHIGLHTDSRKAKLIY